jgi:hypothetical protein
MFEKAAWKPEEEHERHAPVGLTAGPVPPTVKKEEEFVPSLCQQDIIE